MYLELATDLGDRLLGAFTSPSGIPWSGTNLAKREGIPDKGNQGVASLAEAASLQLEMKYLSHLTGDQIYWRKAEKVRGSHVTGTDDRFQRLLGVRRYMMGLHLFLSRELIGNPL